MNRYIGRQSLATVVPRSGILAGDRPTNIDQYVGRQSWATVGPRSEILSKDRPANINRYIGRQFLATVRPKIRNTSKRPVCQHKSIHRPPMFGHGWTKIRNNGKGLASQHRSKHWLTNLGPLSDQDQKYWPTIAGMDWYWTNIDPVLCVDWAAALTRLKPVWNDRSISHSSKTVSYNI